MKFTSHDIMIIESALRTAIKHDAGSRQAKDYQEVLQKLQESAKQALAPHIQTASADHDGIRYDYDDSSDLM